MMKKWSVKTRDEFQLKKATSVFGRQRQLKNARKVAELKLIGVTDPERRSVPDGERHRKKMATEA